MRLGGIRRRGDRLPDDHGTRVEPLGLGSSPPGVGILGPADGDAGAPGRSSPSANPDYVGAVNAMNSLAAPASVLFWTVTHLARRLLTQRQLSPWPTPSPC